MGQWGEFAKVGDGKENFGKEIAAVCYPASSYPRTCKNSLGYWAFCTLIIALVFARQNSMIWIDSMNFQMSVKSILFALQRKALCSQRFCKASFF